MENLKDILARETSLNKMFLDAKELTEALEELKHTDPFTRKKIEGKLAEIRKRIKDFTDGK